MNKYIYIVKELLDLNSSSIKEWGNSIEGIKLSDLKVKDLVFHNGLPIRSGNGVYIFKEENLPIYVGNCVSRNFVERIPGHFNIRHNGWFNSLLVTLIRGQYRRKHIDDKTDDNLTNTAKLAFENLDLVLINFPKYNKPAINKLEDFLRITLDPLNRFKHKKLTSKDITVGNYIEYY